MAAAEVPDSVAQGAVAQNPPAVAMNIFKRNPIP